MNDLNNFFAVLSYTYGVTLYPRNSLIIFDEVQKFPKARQSIKKLVKDGRFDYIETGSLISINENVKDIAEDVVRSVCDEMGCQVRFLMRKSHNQYL